LAPGRFEVIAPNGIDPLTGKHRKKSRVVYGTAKDAEAALSELLVEVDQGKHAPRKVDPERGTYAELVRQWFQQKRSEGLSPNTCNTYEQFGRYLIQTLGDRRPGDVDVAALEALYGQLTKQGLSGASVRKVAPSGPRRR
jgi:hypothetical protein